MGVERLMQIVHHAGRGVKQSSRSGKWHYPNTASIIQQLRVTTCPGTPRCDHRAQTLDVTPAVKCCSRRNDDCGSGRRWSWRSREISTAGLVPKAQPTGKSN